MKALQKILFIAIFLCPLLSYATSVELSVWVVFVQVFNFSLFVLGFFVLVRKPVQTLFHNRQKDFFVFEEQAALLEKQKQEEYRLWETKLSELAEKEKNIKSQAQKEGTRLQTQKIQELKELEDRLKRSSDFLIHLEVENLKRESLVYWKDQLVQKAKTELSKQASQDSFHTLEKKSFLKFLQTYKPEKQSAV